MRLVGWYWGHRPLHYEKKVYQWFYDDERQEHIHVFLGPMRMDDFGDFYLVSHTATEVK